MVVQKFSIIHSQYYRENSIYTSTQYVDISKEILLFNIVTLGRRNLMKNSKGFSHRKYIWGHTNTAAMKRKTH